MLKFENLKKAAVTALIAAVGGVVVSLATFVVADFDGDIDRVEEHLGKDIDQAEKRLGEDINQAEKRLGEDINRVEKRLGEDMDRVEKRMDAGFAEVRGVLTNIQKDLTDARATYATKADLSDSIERIDAHIARVENRIDAIEAQAN